jgi:hypothetical protein
LGDGDVAASVTHRIRQATHDTPAVAYRHLIVSNNPVIMKAKAIA